MNSDNDTDRTLSNGGTAVSATPSIALLNRRLGISPDPRMLTESEIRLLQKCAAEAIQVGRKIVKSKGRISKP